MRHPKARRGLRTIFHPLSRALTLTDLYLNPKAKVNSTVRLTIIFLFLTIVVINKMNLMFNSLFV